MNISFDDLLNQLEEHDSHWQESAKLDFAMGLSGLMSHRNMSKSDLARKIGKSPAYITKVLRGDTNFTIETMVTLVRALEGALHLKVCDRSQKARFVSWYETPAVAPRVEWPSFEPAKTKSKIKIDHSEGPYETIRLAA